MGDDESSVRVAVRIRPQIPREVIEMCRVCTSVTPGEPQITLSADRSFTFDYVFDTPDDQMAVYDTCVKQLVDGALEGYNATVLAYGQTGSGKTYTMGTGFEVETAEQQLGILPRAIAHLFAGIRDCVQNARHNNEPSPEFQVHAQFMELYNDDIIDLLDQGFIARVKSLKIHEDPDGGISVKGITQQNVSSAAEALNLLRQGALSRTTGATQMNSQSSRSHAIFTLLIKQQRLVKIEDGEENSGKSEFATLTAKFHFVDLAGSERLKRTQATGERAREGININAGLFALGNVISALGDKSKKAIHVPYRDSKLTRLLQDSLGGNSQTVMIACISPSDSDFMETLNTLNYANRARNIKNKVMVNQDKSSRTIALLRQQIQDLQVQLLEYQQGKRLVSSDGVEVVNDMCHENLLLQTEANNLRTRLKALQETVDSLSKKNSELLAEKATGAWLSDGEGKDVKEFITEYLHQIEELRAKLLESESMCQQLRKAVSRQPGLAMSPTNMSASVLSVTSVPSKLHKSNHRMPVEARTLFKSDHNLSYSATSELIAEARMDLSKDLNLLAKHEKQEKNGNDDDEEIDSDENEDDSDSESSDTEDKESQYGLEIAELSNEISIKQKLIDELERSQQRMLSMKQHYEDKLIQLQDRIRATQDERDKVLASFSNQHNQPANDKVKKVRDEYERKLTEMQRDVRRLESARKEHARLLKEQNQQSTQLRSLRSEVDEMKRIKVSLIRKMKEETLKHKQSELKHTREIAALRKESRQRENKIRSLQAENRVKEAVLRRRAEEVTALRSRNHPGLSSAAAGRVKRRTPNAFSPKLAKTHWSKLENNITKVKVSKKAVVLVERDMERLINERESLGKELEQLIKKRDQMRLSPYSNSNEIRDLQEQIDSAQATLSYIQESISDCQHNIIQMEGTKEDGDSFELEGLLSQVSTLDEGKYLIEKLYNAITAQALAQVQTELNLETASSRVQQLTYDNDTQNQLLQHLISSHQTGVSNELERPTVNACRSGSSSSSSTRSNSPTHALQTSITRGLNEKKSNSSSDSLVKSRRLTALPKDLLYPAPAPPKQEPEEDHHSVHPMLHRSLSHSINTPNSLRLNTVKPTELPQSLPTRKVMNPESVSPRLPRRATNLSSTKLDMEAAESPPGSPTTYRRFNSREENVFSRLTGGFQGTEANVHRGAIQSYTGKVNPKAPLICAHVASGHTRAVLSVAATDDRLFTGSKDRSVKVWDLQTGVELQTLGGHANNVDVVKYCPINRLLFSVSSAYVKVWDLREAPSLCVKTLCSSGLSMQGPILPTTPARTLTVPPGESQINDIALNPSGRALFTAAGDKVRVWDIRKFSSTGKLAGGHQAAVMCLAVAKLSETEDCVVTGSKDHYIKVFEVAAEAGGVFLPKMTLDPPHYDGIQTLALHGDILFSGSRDMCIKKWDLSRQELIQSMNNAHGNWICGLEVLPGGERLVSGCRSGILKIWAIDSCGLLGEVKAHSSTINSVAVNSSHLFTASRQGCMLQHGRSEDMAAFELPISYVHVNWENVATFPVDAFDNTVRFWKPTLGRLVPEKTSPVKERTSPSLTSSIGRSGRSAWVS